MKTIEEQIQKSAEMMVKIGIYDSRQKAEIEIRESWERIKEEKG